MQKKRMNESQEILARVRALLGDETTLSLATTGDDGEACLAPVFYIADEELALYWLSSKSSRHSRNLLGRPRAAAAVYRNTANWREILGVQMDGAASMVNDPARRTAIVKAYCERFHLGTLIRPLIRRSDLFVFQPDSIRLIDNAQLFAGKIELLRGPEGWRTSRCAH
jgi:hypothetical protein